MSEKILARIEAKGPKKILACDGGGILGLISVGLLTKLEADLRQARSEPDLVLGDYFDSSAAPARAPSSPPASPRAWT